MTTVRAMLDAEGRRIVLAWLQRGEDLDEVDALDLLARMIGSELLRAAASAAWDRHLMRVRAEASRSLSKPKPGVG